MKIFLKVKPKAKVNRIEKVSENIFHVLVKEPPKKGRANEAVVAEIAKYFNVPKVLVKIISGGTSRNKVIEILEK